MTVIVVGGMIGLGKSSVAKVLGEHLGSDVFYEKVEGNRVLEKFYTASPEEIESKRYPFLLQLEFLSSRYKSIKEALSNDNNVLDRSIYEDRYFMEINHKLGRISDLERELYLELLDNMLEELDELQYKKKPDLMVYLTGSFNTVLDRINKRSRDCEQDPELIEYFRVLWESYDEWMYSQYTASEIVTIDMDKMDVVNNIEDRHELCKLVDDALGKKQIEDTKVKTLKLNCEIDAEDNMDITYYPNDNGLAFTNYEDEAEATICLDAEDTKKLKNFLNKNIK